MEGHPAARDSDGANMLDRQHLDGRFAGTFPELAESVAGFNSQTPRAAYVACWTRCADAPREELTRDYTSYKLVRVNVMRGTLHTLTPRQYALWWPALQPTLARVVNGFCRGFTSRVDPLELCERAVTVLERHGPLDRRDLGRALVSSFPDSSADDLGFAARLLAPIVQTAESVTWDVNRPTYVSFRSIADVDLGDPTIGRADLARSYASSFAGDVNGFAYWTGMTLTEARQERRVLQAPPALGQACAAPRPAYVLPEFDNTFFAAKNQLPFTPWDAKRRLLFGAAQMKGSVIDRGRIVAEWQRHQGDLIVKPWGGGLSQEASYEWGRFESWYLTKN